MEPGPSALELLRPDGVAHRVTVIGAGCPDVLRPRRPAPAHGEHADLVIVAPTRAEVRQREWARRAVEASTAALAQDGLVYVLTPPRVRRRFVRLLAERGIEPRLALFHDPDTDGTRCLVPLSPDVAAYAFTSLIATRPRRRRAFLRALHSRRLARFVAHALPQIGIAAGRPTDRPLFAWLFAETDGDAHLPLAVVTVSWRTSEGSLVAHGFEAKSARPSVVAKVRGAGDPRPAAEAAVLRHLGPAARTAGAAVPEPLAVQTDQNRTTLFETAVEGRAAAALLGETPALAQGVTTRLAEWLESWNLDTRSDEVLAAEWLEEAIAAPARALALSIPGSKRYLEWLDAKCSALTGRTVPLVATHNDLTMVNVFVASTGALGVVDWEAARDRDFPLVDFYYAAVDAAAAARRYADRPAAFRALFGAGARATSPARQLESRLMRALDLGPEIAELAFHACWIRHAGAEQTATAQARARPFLEILRSASSVAR